MTGRIWEKRTIPGEVPLNAGRTGTGDSPIVAIHGLSGDHHYFDSFAQFLQHPAGVLGIDLRGRGDSGKPLFGYGLDAHAADVIRMLDHESINKFTLVGHSMGGYVALAIAKRYPERVQGVVLLDAGWPRTPIPMFEPHSISMLAGLWAAMVRLALHAPFAEYNAVQQDAMWVSTTAPTATELTALSCPVLLLRATEGFYLGAWVTILNTQG